MRRLFAVSLIALIASSAAAAPAPPNSWGKAGVSLVQYRQDAVDCAVQGYNLDISKTDDAKEFVRASRQLDTAQGMTSIRASSTPGDPNGNSYDILGSAEFQQHIVDSIRPEERFKSIKKLQIATTDECLVKRGYSQFILTDDQRHHLSKLKFGSDERRAYLHSLASDPAVLRNQRVAGEP
jgi:hypothetical protein